jgi:hypothetical protein
MTNTSLDAALNELERVVAMWRRVSLAAKDLIEAKTATYRARNGRDVGIEDESGEKMWIVPSDLMSLLEGAIEHDFPETKSVPAQSPDDDELIGLNARLADALDEIRHLKAALSGNAQSTAAEHIAWLRQYIDGMTADNWQDMKLRASRQLETLAALAPGNAGAVETHQKIAPLIPTLEMVQAAAAIPAAQQIIDGVSRDVLIYRAMVNAASTSSGKPSATLGEDVTSASGGNARRNPAAPLPATQGDDK